MYTWSDTFFLRDSCIHKSTTPDFTVVGRETAKALTSDQGVQFNFRPGHQCSLLSRGSRVQRSLMREVLSPDHLMVMRDMQPSQEHKALESPVYLVFFLPNINKPHLVCPILYII